MRSRLISIVLGFALTLAACQSGTQQESTTPKASNQAEIATAVNDIRGAYKAALNAGDATAVAALFTDDAVSMPPDAPAAVGKEAIQSNLEARFNQFKFDVTITQAEAVAAGDWAFSRGTYTVKATPKGAGEAMENTGKYLDVLRQQPDGSWKIARHIWNTDKPIPSAARN